MVLNRNFILTLFIFPAKGVSVTLQLFSVLRSFVRLCSSLRRPGANGLPGDSCHSFGCAALSLTKILLQAQ